MIHDMTNKLQCMRGETDTMGRQVGNSLGPDHAFTKKISQWQANVASCLHLIAGLDTPPLEELS